MILFLKNISFFKKNNSIDIITDYCLIINSENQIYLDYFRGQVEKLIEKNVRKIL